MPDTRAIEAELRRLLEFAEARGWTVSELALWTTDNKYVGGCKCHLPALLDELERLRAENAELRAKSDSLDWLVDDA